MAHVKDTPALGGEEGKGEEEKRNSASEGGEGERRGGELERSKEKRKGKGRRKEGRRRGGEENLLVGSQPGLTEFRYALFVDNGIIKSLKKEASPGDLKVWNL